MSSKLYVSNLGQAATLASMRQLFGTCGDVLDVAFAPERGSRGLPSAAYVTMATSVAADKALKDLHGRLHGDRVLTISRLSDDTAPSPGAGGRNRRPPPDEAKVTMTQQYRDRRGLTYELSSSGKLLTLRFVFPVDDAHDWQVEALITPGSTTAVTASAMTREQAFRALIDACGASGAELADTALDWEGVGKALRAVRAL
jgi:hypothetical protein